jgi:acylphosphatase
VNAERASLNAAVYGRVQGVFFRAYVVECARELGVTGFVRNQIDGSVEVRGEGDRRSLEELVGRLKAGPPSASVIKVDVQWAEYTGKYTGFNVT